MADGGDAGMFDGAAGSEARLLSCSDSDSEDVRRMEALGGYVLGRRTLRVNRWVRLLRMISRTILSTLNNSLRTHSLAALAAARSAM